jgi:hypothetical protein
MEKLEIVVFTWTNDGWETGEVMFINGKESLYVYDLSECPEDASIGRDLVSCSDVAAYMEMAAGKEVIIKKVEGNPDEMDDEELKKHLIIN